MTAPDPDNSNSDLHYRLYNSPKEGPAVICVQWFDYLDYDASRFMTPEAYDTEDEAEAALRALRYAATTSTGQLLDIEPNPHPARAWHAATPPVCPECGASQQRAHALFEAVEDAVNYYVCCEEYSADRCKPIIDRVSKVMGEHADWFYDDARPWMKPDPAPGGEGGTDG